MNIAYNVNVDDLLALLAMVKSKGISHIDVTVAKGDTVRVRPHNPSLPAPSAPKQRSSPKLKKTKHKNPKPGKDEFGLDNLRDLL